MSIKNITLSDDQQDALTQVCSFLAEPTPGELVLSGPAGVGKSTLLEHIINEAQTNGNQLSLWKLLFNTHQSLNVYLTATTNKAASVLRDMTGDDVTTIHKLLALTVKNDYTTGHTKVIRTKKSVPISNALLIIDEVSMINEQLLKMIRDLTVNCKVLYVGDRYQLPPVKENTSPVFTSVATQVTLTKILRQASGSPIIQFASQFRDSLDTSKFPIIGSHGSVIEHLSDDDFRVAMEASFDNVSDPNNTRVLCWTNARVHQYNNHIRGLHTTSQQYTLNERLTTNAPIMKDERQLIGSDKIVEITSLVPGVEQGIDGFHVELNYEHSSFLAHDFNHVNQLIKHYAKHKDWRAYFAAKEFFCDLRPYYASTVNKAQGSTYKNVFIDVSDIGKNTKSTEISRLMYTAITRSSMNVYLRGDLPKRLYK